MKKMKLDPDHLRVETFDTVAPSRARRGTVRGNMAWSGLGTCRACTDFETCIDSCAPTCGFDPSCEETVCQQTCVLPETCGCPSSVQC